MLGKSEEADLCVVFGSSFSLFILLLSLPVRSFILFFLSHLLAVVEY